MRGIAVSAHKLPPLNIARLSLHGFEFSMVESLRSICLTLAATSEKTAWSTGKDDSSRDRPGQISPGNLPRALNDFGSTGTSGEDGLFGCRNTDTTETVFELVTDSTHCDCAILIGFSSLSSAALLKEGWTAPVSFSPPEQRTTIHVSRGHSKNQRSTKGPKFQTPKSSLVGHPNSVVLPASWLTHLVKLRRHHQQAMTVVCE